MSTVTKHSQAVLRQASSVGFQRVKVGRPGTGLKNMQKCAEISQIEIHPEGQRTALGAASQAHSVTAGVQAEVRGPLSRMHWQEGRLRSFQLAQL